MEIRNATSGSLIASFTPAGTIKALALDGGLVAVLLEGPGGGKRIERYNAGTGAFIASTSISRAAAAELDIAGNRIVFRTGRQIRQLVHHRHRQHPRDREEAADRCLHRGHAGPPG